MRIWLDDERDPNSPTIQKHFGANGDEVWVKTAEMAIYYLSQNNVKSISLDHDLGDDSAGTGMDVAKYIEEKAFFKTLPKLTWSVHSQNTVGKKNMLAALKNADRYWSQ